MNNTPIQRFLIGQRVIVGDEIGHIVRPTEKQRRPSNITGRLPTGDHWVETSRGASCYDDSNVRPLPGGQL